MVYVGLGDSATAVIHSLWGTFSESKRIFKTETKLKRKKLDVLSMRFYLCVRSFSFCLLLYIIGVKWIYRMRRLP